MASYTVIFAVQTAARMLPVYQKMYDDSNGRLRRTLNILRACRLFNFTFVGKTDILALNDEIEQLNFIPKCIPIVDALKTALPDYKARADAQCTLPEADRLSLWDFWRTNSLALPEWWVAAKEAALVTPSSCTVERVFSLLVHGMDDNQRSALEDYMCASVMVRYNRIWTDRDASY